MKMVFLTALMSLGAATVGHAQLGRVPDASAQARAREVLAAQGVDEAELRSRLATKGIDVDNMTVEQLIAARPTIEATVAEIKAEQASAEQGTERQLQQAQERAVKQGALKAERVRDAVEEGASVKEAVAEAAIAEAAAGDTVTSAIYGHNVFKNKTLEVYRGTEQARAPNSYVLDTGDELAISIFGASQTDLLLTIGEDGFIRPPGTPRIYLKGRTLGDAKALVRQRLQNYYVFREGQFLLSINAARTLSVSIYGEVERNGTYTLSALNGVLNALVAAGGVTERGSVRNIELVREGKRTKIDVYDFLQRPGQAEQASLRDGDVINVPLASQLVIAQGAFRRPMTYELLPTERLSQLVEYAGGLRPRAATGATRVTRYENGVLSVLDVEGAGFASFDLADGDIVEVPLVEAPIEDYVSVEGSVLIPGRFGFRQNMTVGEALNRAQVRPTARQDVAFLRRPNDDGTSSLIRLDLGSAEGLATTMSRGDAITVLAANRFIDDATVSVEGAIRDSAVVLPFPQEGGMTLEEAILLAGGLETNVVEQAVIIRTPLNNREERNYLRVDISSAADFQLAPLDQVVLYKQERFADAPQVSIAGAVRSPGAYRYDASLTINDLLYLAGGTSFAAALDRVEIYRLGYEQNGSKVLQETLMLNAAGEYSGDFVLQPFDEVYVRSSAEFEEITTVEIRGEVKYPGVYARRRGENRLSDFISRAGGLTSEGFVEGATLYREGNDIGFVILGLDKIVANPTLPSNLILRANDVISVPKPQELVRIQTLGTLAERFGVDSLTADGSIEVAFQGRHDAAWYIRNYAGGFDEKLARKRETTVELASGQIKETRGALGIRHYPSVERGATIRVGLKPTKAPKQPRERSSWGEVAQATVAGLTTLVTLLVLTTQLNR